MLAHLLTGVRLLLVPLSALAFAGRIFVGPLWPAVFVALAIGTDLLDGIAARAQGTASPAGQLFDHATDFLFVSGSLSGAAAAGLVPWALPVLIVVAFTQYVVDSLVLDRRKALRMSRLGRWNGILYFAPLVGIALFRLPVPSAVEAGLRTLVVAMSWLLVASTVASIGDRLLAPRRLT